MTGPASSSTKIFIITGPTASGKTSCSLEFAQVCNGEIINADVGQFYTQLSVGTAKPCLPHPEIPHHLFDVIPTPQSINVTQYRQLVFKKIDEVLAAGKTPILVGGSLFYIKSLFFPPLELESLQSGVELDMQALYDHQSTEELWDLLYTIDSVRALQLYKQDRYRILRALYLWHTYSTKPSECVPQFSFPYNACLIYIAPDQEEHKKNIVLRAEQMLNDGWIEEAQNCLGTEWQSFLEKKGLIGYSDIFSWLQAGAVHESKKDLAIKIVQKTWQYARRQRIFWASFKRQLEVALESQQSKSFLKIFEVQTPKKAFVQLRSELEKS